MANIDVVDPQHAKSLGELLVVCQRTIFDEAIAKADAKAANKGAACKFLVDNAKGIITNLDTLDMREIKRDDGAAGSLIIRSFGTLII